MFLFKNQDVANLTSFLRKPLIPRGNQVSVWINVSHAYENMANSERFWNCDSSKLSA